MKTLKQIFIDRYEFTQEQLTELAEEIEAEYQENFKPLIKEWLQQYPKMFINKNKLLEELK